MRTLLTIALACGAMMVRQPFRCHAQITTDLTGDPDQATISYHDVKNFARALRLMAAGGDSLAILQAEYLDAATPGLRLFADDHDLTPERLRTALRRQPRAYRALMDLPERLEAQEGVLRKAYAALKRTVPDAIFPPTYYLVGASRGINEASPEGILLSMEMSSGAEEKALTALHEMVHIQQALAQGMEQYQSLYGDGPNRTLLALAVREGSATFVAHLASGGRMFEAEHRAERMDFLLEREAAIWKRFETEMLGSEPGEWMWTQPTDPEQPRDIGYTVGFRITEAYYERAPDKAKAVQKILALTDYPAFLASSGYAERFHGRR